MVADHSAFLGAHGGQLVVGLGHVGGGAAGESIDRGGLSAGGGDIAAATVGHGVLAPGAGDLPADLIRAQGLDGIAHQSGLRDEAGVQVAVGVDVGGGQIRGRSGVVKVGHGDVLEGADIVHAADLRALDVQRDDQVQHVLVVHVGAVGDDLVYLDGALVGNGIGGVGAVSGGGGGAGVVVEGHAVKSGVENGAVAADDHVVGLDHVAQGGGGGTGQTSAGQVAVGGPDNRLVLHLVNGGVHLAGVVAVAPLGAVVLAAVVPELGVVAEDVDAALPVQEQAVADLDVVGARGSTAGGDLHVLAVNHRGVGVVVGAPAGDLPAGGRAFDSIPAVVIHGAFAAQDGDALAGFLVAHDDAGAVNQTEDVQAQGGVGLSAHHAAGHAGLLIAEGGGVGDHGHSSVGLEQQLGHHVAAGGQIQGVAIVGGLDVLQDAQLGGQGGHVGLPGGSGELAVLVVADGTQDHSQRLIAGDRSVGLKGGGRGALDVARVGAVADVAREPVALVHVVKVAVVGVQLGAVVVHVAGGQTVDQGRDLGAVDGVGGTEAALVTLKYLHAGQNVGGFLELFGDVPEILEILDGVGGVDGNHQGQSHHHRHDQREELLQVSHWILFPPYKFLPEFRHLSADFE